MMGARVVYPRPNQERGPSNPHSSRDNCRHMWSTSVFCGAQTKETSGQDNKSIDGIVDFYHNLGSTFIEDYDTLSKYSDRIHEQLKNIIILNKNIPNK